MNRSGCRRLRIAGWPLALAMFLLLHAQLSFVTAQEPSYALSVGSHFFRNILHDLDLKPLENEGLLDQDQEHKILIVLGHAKPGLLMGHWFLRFIEQGGAALIATDQELVLDQFGLSIGPEMLRVELGKGFDYNGLNDCIFVEASMPTHPIFEGLLDQTHHPLSQRNRLTQIATNRPSYISGRATGMRARVDPRLKVLANFPASTFQEEPPRVKQPYIFAVGGDIERGRLLVLSDHSVFINAMLWQDDNDNFAFTTNIAKWLKDGNRTHVLFVEEGEPKTTFDIPMARPPLPPPDKLVEAFDKGLANLEKESWFNKVAARVAERLNSARLVNALLVLLTILLGAYGLFRLALARQQFEPRVPLLSEGLAQLLPRVGALDQRHRQMLRNANFWEAARSLAQQSWETALGTALPAMNQPPGSTTLPRPPLRVKGRWWQHWRLRRQVWRLWRLAYGNRPRRITPRKLTRLGNEMKIIQAALADGTLQISA
jgi:hypothetical protein